MSCSDGLLTWIRVQFSNRRFRKSNNTLIWLLGLYMISAVCDILHWIDADASRSLFPDYARLVAVSLAALDCEEHVSKRLVMRFDSTVHHARRADCVYVRQSAHRRIPLDSHTYYHYTPIIITHKLYIALFSREPVFRTLRRAVFKRLHFQMFVRSCRSPYFEEIRKTSARSV